MTIQLTQGYQALVDPQDFDRVSQLKWCYSKGRAQRKTKINGKEANLYMHRFIMNPSKELEVDHINGNSLDNRRINLRICTRKNNSRNTGMKSTNTSGYKGVTWKKDKLKWKAYIKVDYEQVHLGYFDDKLEAARKYNQAAQSYFGEFARLNTI